MNYNQEIKKTSTILGKACEMIAKSLGVKKSETSLDKKVPNIDLVPEKEGDVDAGLAAVIKSTPAEAGTRAAQSESLMIREAKEIASRGMSVDEILNHLIDEFKGVSKSPAWKQWVIRVTGVEKCTAPQPLAKSMSALQKSFTTLVTKSVVNKADDGKFKKGQKAYFTFTSGLDESFRQFDGDEVTIIADKGNGMYLVDFGSGIGHAKLPSRNLVNPKYASMQ